MSLTESFRTLALSFPNTEEAPHFERSSFKVTGKRIFCTLQESTQLANIRLSKADQPEFCTLSDGIYPVPNKWGEQGWTTFDLTLCEEAVVKSAVESAYLLAKG